MLCPACNVENIDGVDYCAECCHDLRDLDLPEPGDSLERGVMHDPIGRLIPPNLLKVAPNTPVRHTAASMIEAGRNCALVVANGRVVGVFTERDVLIKIGVRFAELADRPVSDFMTPDPECLGPEATLAHGLNRMMVGDYRHIPIVADGEPLGVVSVRHVLGYIAQRHPDLLLEAPA